MLWHHVFQVVKCVLGAVQHATHKSRMLHSIPEDGSGGPKHVGANVRYFNANFNILYG